MWYIYSGILLSHYKEWNNAIWCNIDGLRDCHTEWNKSKKDIWHPSYVVSKKKWYKWTHLQNRNRLTDLENELMLPRGEGLGEGMVREFRMGMCPLLYLKWITNKDLLYSTGDSAQCYVSAWMGVGLGGEWILCICMAESLHCSSETVTPLFVNGLYPNTK